MKKINFYFGENKNNYGYQLLSFLEANDFYLLPNYPFEFSLDEMLYEEDEELIEIVQKYCYYCLTNLGKVIEENM